MDETKESLNKKLKLEIEEGRIEIGELIVPKSYDKVVISNGKFGRNIPLESIRKNCLKNNKNI